MTPPTLFIISMIAAYLAGSVNVSILVFRATGRQDPRRHGSGNPGTTNVYRQAGIGWAATVLLLDMARAMVVALLACTWLPLWQVPWVAFGLILGNRFPCFHGFKGGKGVANYLGFSMIVAPMWAGGGLLAWGGAHLIWHTPFLSSFAMVFCLTIGTVLAAGGSGWGLAGTLITALFIVGCHHRNIHAYWSGRRAH